MKCRMKTITQKLQNLATDRKTKSDSVMLLQCEYGDSVKETARLRSELPSLESEVDKLRFLAQGLLEFMPQTPC
jgi:hypothetical protein